MFDVKDVEVEHEEIASHEAKNLKAEGKHSLLSPTFDHSSQVEGLCTKPLSCFGCGIGWFWLAHFLPNIDGFVFFFFYSKES